MVTIQILTDKIIIHSWILAKDNLSVFQEDGKGNIDILQSLDIYCSDESKNSLKKDSITSLDIEVTSDRSWLFLNWEFIKNFKNLKVLRIDNKFAYEVTWRKCKHIIAKDIEVPILFAWCIDRLDILWKCGDINISWQSYSDGHNADRIIIKNLTIWSDKKDIKSVRLNNLEVVESFYINHCHLEKLFLMNVLLWNTNYIHDTTLGSCFVYRTELTKLYSFNNLWKWLYNIEITNTNDILKDQELKNTEGEIKEYYRQLKFAHDSIWNKTEANKFFAKEMEYYEKSLSWKTDWDKKIISLLQRWISNFWNSWLRAFWFYLLFCILVYLLGEFFLEHSWVIRSHIQGIINFWKDDWRWILLGSESKELARFLNPLPELKEDKNILWIIFSISKILIVYQIVVALRRISQR